MPCTLSFDSDLFIGRAFLYLSLNFENQKAASYNFMHSLVMISILDKLSICTGTWKLLRLKNRRHNVIFGWNGGKWNKLVIVAPQKYT